MVLNKFTNEFKEILIGRIIQATMTENWMKIENYETYSVSDLGRVRNDVTGKFLKECESTRGYLVVSLYKDCEKKKPYIHRLIAQAFIPNPESKDCVDHHDNNPLNNSLENLRWATRSENMRNRQIDCDNTTGVKGVFWNKQRHKWQAQISVDRKKIHLGLFSTIEEATTARRAKANELFGVFTNSCEISSVVAEKLTA
jgi:hypothetical protein